MGAGKAFSVGIVVASLLGVGLVDWATGENLGFFVFYFAPVAIAAWLLGGFGGVTVALGAAFLWLGIESVERDLAPTRFHLYWNGSIRLASFLIIALAVARLHTLLMRERELNTELAEAMVKVKQLHGLLPICATCKKVRNDQGYWEQIELYIESHSHAAFSHGICPECLDRKSVV